MASTAPALGMGKAPWLLAALACWGIALVDYLIMAPANRIGHSDGLTGAQLNMIQECVTLAVFVPIMLLFIGEKWRRDLLWAFFACSGWSSSSSAH